MAHPPDNQVLSPQQTQLYEEIYLKEDRYSKPKELFKLAGSVAMEGFLPPASQQIEVLDVGCATGELVWYLKGMIPTAKFLGIDISESMLEAARRKMPEQTFQQVDILKRF